MTNAITSFTLNGNIFKYLNGSRDEESVVGSIKQWDGANWNRIEIPGKPAEKRISFSGIVETDEEKVLLEALKSENFFTDYSDGVVTLTKCAVMSLSFSYSVSGPLVWSYRIEIEEVNQDA